MHLDRRFVGECQSAHAAESRLQRYRRTTPVAVLLEGRAARLAESLSVTRLRLATSAFHDVFNANGQLAVQAHT